MKCPAMLSVISVMRDAVLLQLPGGQARALEERPRLVHEDVERLPASAAARITPSAVPYSTVASEPVLQWVRIVGPLRHQRRAVRTHLLIDRDVLVGEGAGLGQEARASGGSTVSTS